VTLRIRLLLLGVGIVAAGLLISDVVTYRALRSFLTTRVDQQLEVAAFPVGRALLSSSGLGPEVPAAPPASVRHGGIDGARGSRPSSRFRNGGGFLGRARGAAQDVLVPPGTFGELRSATGTVEAHLFFSYGGKAPMVPTVPAKLPGSGLPAGSDVYFSASSSGAEAVSYRAVAKPLTGRGGAIVVAVPLTELDSTLQQLLLVEVIVSLALLVSLGALTWVMVRRDLRPLDEMARTAGAVAGGDLSQRVVHVAEGTEVGQLGVAFNTMIGEIELAFGARAASEERLRRFLADASHELRTPLTSILGYAELFELGMRDPGDLATAMRHIRDEASRMGLLVDDLFLLAQLDRQRPLHFAPLDLAELAHRSADAVTVAAPDRRVAVVVEGRVPIVGDEHRLRQVIDNLVINAVRHSPPEGTVEIAARLEGGVEGGGVEGGGVEGADGGAGEWAILTVRDEGPGIDPADADRIFEPFYRADPSRARASGGVGLGLAIVKAIIEAHRGTVSVEPGPGGTFVVRVPTRRYPADSAVAGNGVNPADSASHGAYSARTPPAGASSTRTPPAGTPSSGAGRGVSGGDVADGRLGDLARPDARGADVEPLR
jgi:two-component system, OmpR family, sensor kinase